MEYLEFYELDSLLHSFATKLWLSHREELNLPSRYGVRKFREPSGGIFLHASTGKRLLQIRCSEKGATITSTRACAFPVMDFLVDVIEADALWRMVPDA